MEADPSRLRQVLAELRRRRVFRVAVVYAGVAFVTVQAADLLFPALNLPGWTYTFLVALALLGFPLAVALAWAFDITPGGVRRTAGRKPTGAGAAVGGVAPPGRRMVPRVAWFVAGILVAMSGGWLVVARGTGPETPSLDAELIAVFPFRTTGLDPTLAYLGEGMVDLLAAKFTGTGGPRAIDPQTALSAARRAGATADRPREGALELARTLGAGHAILGSVVGTPAGLTVTATLLDASGVERATATVDGPPDRLSAMVHELAAALLSLSAGEAEQRLPSLTSTSLPALRAYLEGQAAVRRARFTEAGGHFGRALEEDSAFVLAALGRAMAIQWVNHPDTWEALRLAWEGRDHLSPRDRVLLEAYAGPSFPELSTMADWIESAERAARAVPDRADNWYWFGDRLFHQGDWTGWPGAQQEAVQHFRRAVALDSSFLQPIIHLLEIAAATGDTAAMRQYGRIYFEADSTSESAIALRWQVAASRGDTTALRALRSQLGQTPTGVLRLVLLAADAPRGTIDDADLIADELRRRTGSRAERAEILGTIARYELVRGRPSRAASALSERGDLLGVGTAPTHIANALYWDGDKEAADRAVRVLEDRIAAADTGASIEHARELCALGQWRSWQGDEGSGEALRNRLGDVLARLRADPSTVPREPGPIGFTVSPLVELDACARVLDATLLVRAQDPGARAAVDALEAFLRAGRLEAGQGFARNGAVILASLWEALGDTGRALAAIRLRLNPMVELPPPAIAIEARLAANAGDRDIAIRLYQHYLRLRTDPEPSLRAEVERVRGELADLIAEGR